MKRIFSLLSIVLLAFGAASAQAEDVSALLDGAIAGDHRPAEHRARDVYRHPKETLLFFGLRPDMTVVEIWPSAGWYTDVLAPVLHDQGRLYAARTAVSLESTPAVLKTRDQAFLARMAARPDVFGKVVPSEILAPKVTDAAPQGSVDMVLTFRNVHNWAKSGNADAMFQAFHALLKPGGVLGVEEHRARPGTAFEDQVRTGYMTEEYVIQAAQRAGFRLEERSELNANPRDTRDHPRGVWTLPPNLAMGATDRDRYLAIGESDRMTLRFVTP